MERSIIIQNESGLHARPASLLVKLATEYDSDINIEVNDKVINVKSIMNVLSAGLQKGTEIKLVAKGQDEGEAIEAIEKLINSGFNEY